MKKIEDIIISEEDRLEFIKSRYKYLSGRKEFVSKSREFDMNPYLINLIVSLINLCENGDYVFESLCYEEEDLLRDVVIFSGESEYRVIPGDKSSYLFITKREVFNYIKSLDITSVYSLVDNIKVFEKTFGKDFMVINHTCLEDFYKRLTFRSSDFIDKYDYVEEFLDLVSLYRVNNMRVSLTNEELKDIYDDFIRSNIKCKRI